MLEFLKSALARSLSPAAVYWLASIKRAILSQPPLPWPFETPSHRSPLNKAVVSSYNDGRTIQDVAIEKYKEKKLPTLGTYYGYEDVLLLPAKEVARTLTLSVQYLNAAHVNGDIAEFGTMGGGTATTIAMAMVFDPQRQPLGKSASGENPFRKLRLFDSFVGLPEIDSPIDQGSPHVVSGAWAKGGCHVLSSRELRERVSRIIPPHRFDIYEGWFADTVKTLPPETRFAMIHFDGDLYQSAMDALEPLFTRGMISTGAVICFDEWNANRAMPSVGERRAWKELVEKFDIEASHGGDYRGFGTKFIIHSYRGIQPEPE